MEYLKCWVLLSSAMGRAAVALGVCLLSVAFVCGLCSSRGDGVIAGPFRAVSQNDVWTKLKSLDSADTSQILLKAPKRIIIQRVHQGTVVLYNYRQQCSAFVLLFSRLSTWFLKSSRHARQ